MPIFTGRHRHLSDVLSEVRVKSGDVSVADDLKKSTSRFRTRPAMLVPIEVDC